MRIRTQFVTTMLFFGITLAVISASAIITSQRVRSISGQEEVISSISQGASELSYLSNDYVIYRESQQLNRWQAKFASFTAQVESLQGNIAEQKALIDSIQANTRRLREVFDSIVSSADSSQNETAAFDPSFLQVSWSRMAVQSQALISDASRLSQLFHTQADRLKQTNLVVIFVMVGVFGAYFAFNYMLIQRRLLKSLATLQAGTAVIGSGNLDFEIKEKRNDEIGDLSRAFNRMTSDLKMVTASKKELETEIDERKKTAEELRKQRDFTSAILDNTGALVVVLDRKGQITRFNQACEATTGYASAEVLGRVLWDFLIPAEDMQGVRETWQALTSGNFPGRHENYWVCKDGSKRLIAWSNTVLLDPAGNVEYVIASGVDITERKKAEESLAEAARQWQTTFDSINDMVSIQDANFRFVRVNRALARVLRKEPEELVSTACHEAIHKTCEPPQGCPHKETLKSGRAATSEFFEPQLGAYLEVSTSPIFDDDGRVVGSAHIARDVTGRKRAEEELRQRTIELEISNKELEAFSYSVSHDLRAPLRSMEGFSSALLEDYAERLDAQGKQYLRYIQDSSDLMGRLIDDLLKLSRISRSEMQVDSVNLTELAQDVVLGLRKAEPGRKVEFTAVPQAICHGDARLLRIALENLLGNAWKFTSKIPQAKVEFGITEQNGRKVYYVRDNGAGFDMTYASKLFLPFQRLHKESEFPGTGIGLASVQRIIRRHGGDIWAEGVVGRGATFYFTLGQ